MLASYKKSLYAAFMVGLYLAISLHTYAQSNSAALSGTVLDPSGAVVPNVTVEMHNPVSHFDRSTTTDSSRKIQFRERSIQSLPSERDWRWVCSLCRRCRTPLRGAFGGQDQPPSGRIFRECDGRGFGS